VTIRLLLARANGALASALAADPMIGYIFPDPQERARMLPWLLGTGLRYSRLYGTVQVTSPACEGVACWVAPRFTQATAWRMFRAEMLSAPVRVGMGALRRFHRVVDLARRLHERTAPRAHWYLIQMGVRPEYRRRGFGQALLTGMLTRIDSEGVACYLETPNHANLPFYQRHGFSAVESAQVAEDGPSLWAMVRPPSAAEPQPIDR
jgi:ribosomal protein S18 acetylase RimI-like enzyme